MHNIVSLKIYFMVICGY